MVSIAGIQPPASRPLWTQFVRVARAFSGNDKLNDENCTSGILQALHRYADPVRTDTLPTSSTDVIKNTMADLSKTYTATVQAIKATTASDLATSWCGTGKESSYSHAP